MLICPIKYGVLPEVTPNVEASPTSPTAAEKASIQELFKEALAQKEGSAPKSPPVFADARNPSIVPSSPTSAERASMQELFRQNSPTQVGEIETGRKEGSAPKSPPVFADARNPNTIPSSPTNAERASIQRLFNEDQKYPQIKGRSSAEVIAEVLRNSPGPNGEPPVGNKWVRFPEGVSHKAIQEELLRTAHENDIRGGATKTGEVQGLSKEDLSTRSMSESITSHDRQQSRILEKYFLNTNVPFQSWTKVRYLPVNSFIADTMERGAGGRHPQALVQLGKVFDEVRNPPYGIIPGDNETTMSYISRAFDAISHAENTGQNTEKIRNFLRNVKGVR